MANPVAAVQPVIDIQKCTACGLCVEVCPAHVLTMEKKSARVFRGDWCIGCGHCVAVCPVEAVIHLSSKPGRSIKGYEDLLCSPEDLDFLLKTRRSIRIYHNKPVPESEIDILIKSGGYAPTGSNRREYGYIVIRDPVDIARLRDMSARYYCKLDKFLSNRPGAFIASLFAGKKTVETFITQNLPKLRYRIELIEKGEDRLLYNAPTVLIIHAPKSNQSSAFDCAAALYGCSLMAHARGLGTCFIGYVEAAVNQDRKLKKWLDIPGNHKCFGVMTLGYSKVYFQRMLERETPPLNLR